MKTRLLLSLILALVTTATLVSCDSGGRGDRRTGAMSAWERSRR